MNNREICELSLISGRDLIAAINKEDLKKLKEFGISEEVWQELSEYINEEPTVKGIEIKEAGGLIPENFFIEDEFGKSGSSKRHNVNICKSDFHPKGANGEEIINYIVEFPVFIGHNEDYTLIFDIFLQNESSQIKYRLLEVM